MRRGNDVVLAAFTAILLFSSPAGADGQKNTTTQPIPDQRSEVNSWFEANVKPCTERNATLDPALAAAEAAAKIITVTSNGTGDFPTIAHAIASIPAQNMERIIVLIGPGVYREKISVNLSQPFVTLYGSPENMPTLVFNGTAAEYGTVDSATLIVEGGYFMAVNMIIMNSSPEPERHQKGPQALAIRISGDKAAFYNCSFIGFQDTLCDELGKHFFKDCYVEGTVDFVFGDGKSIYLNTKLFAINKTRGPSVITAQGRDTAVDDSGYSFVHCDVDGNSTDVYLGRAWMTYPLVVFAYANMSSVVDPAGWSDNFQPERDKTVFYGEYKCMGQGSKLDNRAKFAKALRDEEAEPFLNLAYINASSWLLPPPHCNSNFTINPCIYM